MIVVKFGGSSLADASQFKKVAQIVRDDPQRHYVVPSAPGKRAKGDDKVTDLLYACSRLRAQEQPYEFQLQKIRDRYESIIRELSIDISLDGDFEEISARIRDGASESYIASRGEYLCGKCLARHLGFEFIDAARVIRFFKDGRLDEEKTCELLRDTLRDIPYAVIPGFYGADEDGSVITFSRGGSDISGALVANAVNADVYENWTDVTGFRMADPRIIKDAQFIDSLTYRELREQIGRAHV